MLAILSTGWEPTSAEVHDHITVGRLLLESGADKDAKTGAGETPLYIASSRGFPDPSL